MHNWANYNKIINGQEHIAKSQDDDVDTFRNLLSALAKKYIHLQDPKLISPL